MHDTRNTTPDRPLDRTTSHNDNVSLNALCALKLRRVNTVASATVVHVVPADAGAGLATPPSELCTLLRRPPLNPEETAVSAGAVVGSEEIRFEFHFP